MTHPRLAFGADHLLVELPGAEGVLSAKRHLILPYSTIDRAALEAPHWPALLDVKLGTALPGYVAKGSFRRGEERRFLHFDRGAGEVLTLRLAGHPEFDEVELDVDDPEIALRELEHRLRGREPRID